MSKLRASEWLSPTPLVAALESRAVLFLEKARMSTPATDAPKKPTTPTTEAAARLGQIVSGRYRIQKLLGEGGMGAVYLAEHTAMRKRVALKLLHRSVSDNPEVVARFEREGIAAAKIEHPNVAAATDFGRTEDGSLFLVLEYIEGQSLREVLAAGPMAYPRALHVAKQIALALGRAHEAGIVHRDLKPENVMLVRKGDDPDFVKVLDFGIAKLSGAAIPENVDRSQPLTRMGSVLGTPEYMAPEQALGEAVAPQADLYSLGVILYEMLAGRHVFDPPDRMAMLSFHLVAPVPAIEDRAPGVVVPAPVEAIARKLLEKDAKARYADARALVAAIDAAAGASPSPSQVAPISAPGSDPELWKKDDSYAKTSLGVPSPTKTTASGERPFGLGSALDTVRTLPRPLQLALAAAVPLGLVLVVVALVLATRSDPAPAPSGGMLTGILGPPPSSSGGNGEAREAAKTKRAPAERLTAADAQGVAALEALGKEFPDDPDVAKRLALAYTTDRRHLDAMRVAKALVDANPKEGADPEIVMLVTAAASSQSGDGAEEAFALLEGPLGEKGVDALIDIAARPHVYARRGAKPFDPAGRAQKSLADPAVREHASKPAAVLIDFKNAKGCTARRDLLDRAKDEGDARMLPVLRALRPHRGCGFVGIGECSPCPFLGDPLEDAIRGVEARTK
jgi:serine/threonine-protein kinase